MAVGDRKAFERFMRQLEPELQSAFLQAIVDIRSVAQKEAIYAAIDRGDVQAVFLAMRLGEEFFAPLDQALQKAFSWGAAMSMNTLPKQTPTSGGGPLIIRFQGRNPRAEAWTRREAGLLIREIVSGQQEMIAETIREGIQSGEGTTSIARKLIGSSDGRSGGLLGLTRHEAGYVETLRKALSEPATASEYFNRRARDRRYDGLVRKSIKNGSALSAIDIRRITDRYAARLLKIRAERIARTETIKALNAGRLEGYMQLVDRGDVDADQITKSWSNVQDSRTRNSHRVMRGQKVRLDEAFTSPSGARLMHPGDTSLGANGDEVIGCRCWMDIEIDWLKKVA